MTITNPRRSFVNDLASRVLVCDGGMGTMLYAGGVFVNRAFEELNVTRPEQVASVHRAYVEAGADVLETNTFGANAVKLLGFGLGDQLSQINGSGARIARAAAPDGVHVAGALGPLGVEIAPHGRTSVADAERYFREQAGALLEGGVDLFMLETFRSVVELLAAVRALKATADLPIVAQMTVDEGGDSPDGTSPEMFARQLEDAGAAVIGVNCGTGPVLMLETVERLRAATALPLVAQPNAGLPRQVEGRTMYLSSPCYMGSYARRFVQHGVKLVGGCCGTTPDHVREIKTAVLQPT